MLAFASGVRELDAGERFPAMDEADDAREAVDVAVAPDPEILRADAALGGDRRRFGQHQRGAADARGCRDARGASRWRSRRRSSTGTSAKRRCGWQASASGAAADRRDAACQLDSSTREAVGRVIAQHADALRRPAPASGGTTHRQRARLRFATQRRQPLS